MYRHRDRDNYLQSLGTRAQPGRGKGGRARSQSRGQSDRSRSRGPPGRSQNRDPPGRPQGRSRSRGPPGRPRYRKDRMRSDAGEAFLGEALGPASFGRAPRGKGLSAPANVFVMDGNGLRAPQTKAELRAAREFLSTDAGPRRPRKPPRVAKSDYGVYQLIRDRMGPLKEMSKKSGVHFDERAQEAMGLEAILRQASDLASDLMSGTGFFAGRDPKLLPGLPLRYLHNGRTTVGMAFPEDKVPEYLAKFDDALKGISTESEEEKFKAVFVFMGRLLKAVRNAINSQDKRVKNEKRSHEKADRMAESAHVSKGDYRTVVGEIAEKVLRSTEKELEAMSMTDQMNQAIPLQIVLRLAPEVGGEKINWEKFLKFIARDHPGHFHFVQSRAVNFKKAIKRAKTILYHRRKAEEKKEGRVHVHAAAEAPAAAAQPAAGLAQRLVSLRYD